LKSVCANIPQSPRQVKQKQAFGPKKSEKLRLRAGSGSGKSIPASPASVMVKKKKFLKRISGRTF
jgi:hypothetical protein